MKKSLLAAVLSLCLLSVPALAQDGPRRGIEERSWVEAFLFWLGETLTGVQLEGAAPPPPPPNTPQGGCSIDPLGCPR